MVQVRNVNYPNYKEALFVRPKGERHFKLTQSSPFWELEHILKVDRPYSPKYVNQGIALIVESPKRTHDKTAFFTGLRNLPSANWYEGNLVRKTRSKQGAKSRQVKDLILVQISEDSEGLAIMRMIHIPKFRKYPKELKSWANGFLELVISKRGHNG
jgi:hypothetical protein